MTDVAPDMTALAPPTALTTTNRNASPARSPSNHSSPTGSRLNLANDRRDDKEKIQERVESKEERGRKMEESKRKEQRRRAAAGEKRRAQQEAEKERLEALVRRRGGKTTTEPKEQLDNRPKRWTWGGPPDGLEGNHGNPKTPPCPAIGCALPNELPAASNASQSRNVGDFLSPPAMDQPINKQLSNSSTAIHSPERVSFVSHRKASPNNHRPNRSSSNRRSLVEETSRAKTPTGETPNTPARSSSFRANSKGPATPKRVRSTRSRAQSPCSPGQYPPSPLRQRVSTPGTEERGHGALERKATKSDTAERKIPKSASKELNAESPGTPTGRSVGGTTDAEEASRLLAERRRLARIQKELEERQRQEDERLRVEEEQRRQQEARERQEKAALQAEEEKNRREEEDRRVKEQRWKDMQDELDKEREEACLRAQKEAERKRQERELLHIQEEQERLQRRKRIEEIMKRTRGKDVEPLSGAAVCDRAEASAPLEADVTLGPLENKICCVDELSDGVQSMDVSPVSRDEQASAHEFSPVTEGTEGLDQLIDMGQGGGVHSPLYPKLQAGSGTGDLNKNLLIQGYASESTQLIHSIGPSKLDV